MLNRKILDRVITVTDDEAYQTAKLLAKKEGLLVGISAGANVFAAQKIADELGPGKNVVTILATPASAISASRNISIFRMREAYLVKQISARESGRFDVF